MTVSLERRFANFRQGLARPENGPGEQEEAATRSAVVRGSSVAAERLAAEVDGELVRTAVGCFVRVEGRGDVVRVDRERLARLPGQPPAEVPLLCLDTETTGLATAAGTLAFLVGLGWWEGRRFRQVQLLLPDHADEPALLDALRAMIPAGSWLVTYNGRGFDWPLLVARYRMARSGAPAHAGHLDLLPIVRRLFRHRMTDARLQTAEVELLGHRRHRDVEGWEIPTRYLQFLRDGEPARLIEIVRHNDEDVLSLARLLAHVDTRLGDEAVRYGAHAGDLAGLARAFTAHRRYDEALACVDAAIVGGSDGATAVPVRVAPAEMVRPEPHLVCEELDQWWSPRRVPDFGGRSGREGAAAAWRTHVTDRMDAGWTASRLAVERARLLRRLGRYPEAEAAWLGIADAGGTLGALAWTEVAKLREHRRRDPEAALGATLAALRLVERRRFLGRPDARLERDLTRRTLRLRRRIARRTASRRASSRPAGSGAVDLGVVRTDAAGTTEAAALNGA